MVEINFSVIADLPEDLEPLTHLMQEFEAQSGIQVQLQPMSWDQAWSDLLKFARYGKGPDISHVGSTWTTALVGMNALRPFSPQEVAALGKPETFIPSVWQSARPPGEKQVWTLPWSAYTFILLYRRDLLEQAGVEAQTAFETPAAMAETLRRLQAAGFKAPWVISSVAPYLDLVHITASWVWGARGDFVNRSGNRMLINGAEARAGLKAFFELYRYLPASAYHWDDEQCFALFAGGEAAVIITGVDWVLNMVKLQDAAPETLAHLGATTLPGISWIGGDNLVIWSHNVRSYSAKREQAAVSLANFLVSQATQVKYSRLTAGLPVRFEALSELTITPQALAQTIERALRTGRPHQAISLWTRIEHQLGQALSQVGEALLSDPTAEIDTLLVQYVEPVARRLDQILRY